jgi:hypothetical protein
VGKSLLLDKASYAQKEVFFAKVGVLQSGYEDFSDYEMRFDNTWTEPKSPPRTSTLDDLVHYWTIEKRPPGFSSVNLVLFDLYYFPLKILASEHLNTWKSIIGLVESCERILEETNQDLTSLETLLHRAHRWRRVLTTIEDYCQSAIDLVHAMDLRKEMSNYGWSLSILQDYQYLLRQFRNLGTRIDRMTPLVTSLIQIIESRRSLKETTNLSRLTKLAFIFVPLSFVSGLFSMSGSLAPGSSHFWVYFAVAVPVAILTFTLTQVPHVSSYVKRNKPAGKFSHGIRI